MSDEGVVVALRRREILPPDPDSPEAILALARDEAAVSVAAALGEAEGLREAARRDGREQGLAEGRAIASDEMAGALAALQAVTDGLAEQGVLIEEAAVREATVLAVEVAARLVRAEVAARPERVAEVLRGAIRRAADRSRLVARVSPSDLAACRAAAPVIMEEMGGIAGLEVIDDPRITCGSCVLETSAGDVDATFESQLARVLEALAAPPDESLVA